MYLDWKVVIDHRGRPGSRVVNGSPPGVSYYSCIISNIKRWVYAHQKAFVSSPGKQRLRSIYDSRLIGHRILSGLEKSTTRIDSSCIRSLDWTGCTRPKLCTFIYYKQYRYCGCLDHKMNMFSAVLPQNMPDGIHGAMLAIKHFIATYRPPSFAFHACSAGWALPFGRSTPCFAFNCLPCFDFTNGISFFIVRHDTLSVKHVPATVTGTLRVALETLIIVG